jgi:hypothetical protein
MAGTARPTFVRATPAKKKRFDPFNSPGRGIINSTNLKTTDCQEKRFLTPLIFSDTFNFLSSTRE